MTIGIINIGIGNVASIKNMLTKLGYSCELVEKPSLAIYDWIILPGVGAFDNGIKKLRESGWYSYLKNDDAINTTSVLGICLGMQLLTNGSEEGDCEGLNLIPGYFKKFTFSDKMVKVPHMGWNEVEFNHPLLCMNQTEFGLPRFYFVHSYYYSYDNLDYELGKTNYHGNFISAIKNNNIWGFQFHPEKSHNFGMSLFKEVLK